MRKPAAICLKTGKPHRWRPYPKKRIRYRYKDGRKIVYPVCECADCGKRIAPGVEEPIDSVVNAVLTTGMSGLPERVNLPTGRR
jgi:hypothetical protein